MKQINNKNSKLNEILSLSLVISFLSLINLNLYSAATVESGEFISSDVLDKAVKEGAKKDAALIEAVKNNKIDEVKKLINSGAFVNSIDNNGATPLIMAAIKGYKDIAKLLISLGANVNAVGENRFTALMFAADKGNKDMVELLLASGADVNKINKFGNKAIDLAKLGLGSESEWLSIDEITKKNKQDIVKLLENQR